MTRTRQLFAEFKSIFVTEDLLQENERHANIVTATTLFNIFLILLLTYVLVYLDFFKLNLETTGKICGLASLLLFLPSCICFILHGNGKWLKQVMFICITFMLALADAMLKYNVSFVMVIPVILASRYYNRAFTVGVAILTVIFFGCAVTYGARNGIQDLNTYNLIIPEHTVIEVDGRLRDALENVEVNEKQRLYNIYIHFFLPKLFIYFIIAFACVQISRSGKNMIDKQKEITQKSARIETELNLANSIQKNMLPSIFPPFPEHKEIDIYAYMTPAKEVGGDFYDMFLIDEDHLGLVIADVSGKGIPAALFMMIAKTIIKNIALVQKNVDEVFNRVNSILCEGNKVDLFLTSWFGVVNLKTGHVEFVNAGHNPPLVYSSETNKYDYLKVEPNLVLASMDNIKYIKHETNIKPGDKIFLYTDGVVESINNKNEQYSEKRLLDYLNNHIELNAQETIEGLKDDLNNFIGHVEQFDDITMLEFGYKQIKEIVTEKTLEAKLDNLSEAQKFVSEEMEKLKCSTNNIRQMDLVVEEIFVNIAKYAYEGKRGDCKISVSLDANNFLKIVFEDSGIEFNPLDREDPDIDVSLEERTIGGLGIFLSKEVVDDIDYRYENNKNILTITKKVSIKED